jgi:hypothetical protein
LTADSLAGAPGAGTESYTDSLTGSFMSSFIGEAAGEAGFGAGTVSRATGPDAIASPAPAALGDLGEVSEAFATGAW